MSLTVKAYLKKSGVDEFEIRRFAVDLDVSTNYNYLVGKITSVFQGLANKTIQLHWKDAEKDAITFSSDEELIEALGFVNDGVFKVYVEEKASPVSSAEPHVDRGVLHHGVVCDGCEGPVYGTRHKCSVCPDYDLCMGCKSTGLHSEHVMIPIENPARRHEFMMGMPGMMPPHFPHPGMMPHHPGMMPHHPGMMPPHQGMMPPPYGHPPCSFAPGASGPNPPFFGQNQTASPEEHRNMRRAWRRWWRTTYAEPWKKCKKEKKEEKKREKKERKEKKKAEKMAEGGAAKAENESSSSSSSDEGEASPNGDYLKSVGESVAAMLDPLGIDVEVDVEHRGQRRRCHRGGHHRGGPWGYGMHGHFGGLSCGFRGGRGGHCPWRPTPSTASEPMPQPQQTNPTGPSQAPQEKGRDVDTNSETGEIASGVPTPMASGNFTKANDMFEGNGWTFIPPPANLEEEVEGATRGVEQLNVSAEAPPQYVPVSGDYPNADPLVQAAVADMQRMGFSDDGGWLTALLTAYGGDIGRALDAINAKK